MLSVLMTAFLSFSIINGTQVSNDPYATSETSVFNQPSIYGPNGGSGDSSSGSGSSFYNELPNPNVTLGEFEVTWWRNGLVGRHQMASIDSYQYVDFLPIKRLTKFYNETVIDDFVFKDKVSSITENTISTTIEVSASYAEKIAGKISVDGFGIEVDKSSKNTITIKETETYSYSVEETYEVDTTIKKEVVEGKKFAICLAAFVFEVTCSQWQYDDYWWGKQEVSGSRSNFTTYLVLCPTITVLFSNGDYIK